jgi:elongation factor G
MRFRNVIRQFVPERKRNPAREQVRITTWETSMRDVPIADVRNFVLMGHTHSGKTTLADAFLHQLGVTNTMGLVDEGTSFLDVHEEEKEKKITVWAKPCTGMYTTKAGKRVEMVFIDTPGYVDFHGQVMAAARVADTGLIVVDAASGIQIGTHRAWKLCEQLGLPRGIVITGLDRENADFMLSVAQIQETFGAACVPVILPNADLSAEYSVMASLDIPPELQATVRAARQTIVEDAAETDDRLIEKYLAGEELTAEELAHGLHAAVNNRSLVPVFAVAAKREFGVVELLEAICRYFPSPEDHGATDAEGNRLGVGADQPFAGEVWRCIHDPFAGQLSFVRVFAGTLRSDSEIYNASKRTKEKVGQLIAFNGEKQEQVAEARAGDIVAIPKLKNTGISDSLCAVGSDIRLHPIVFPNPVVSHAVVATKKGEEDKVITGLQRMAEDDPTIRVERNAETHDLILSGMGDIQLELAVQRMKRRTNVELELRTPRVPYRETVTAMGEGKYRHKKQSGGRGQFGEVYLRVEPLPPGEEEWFVNAIVGGAIPSNFIPAVHKGLIEGHEHGCVAGYPVQDIRVTVYDGSYHAVDSSEVAFKIAASRALREASAQAKPVLLEPIMEMRVTVPDMFMGDVNGDLSHRRGRVLGMEVDGNLQTVTAEAPMAELFRYSSELRSMTGGRGTFEVKFSRYEPVPANVAQQIIKDREAARTGEE